MKISYRHLPLKLYELTHFSFRREQSGELSGLKRLRTFTMPDMHTLCTDVEQAQEEMLKQVDLSYQWMKDLGFQYTIALRAVKNFFDETPEYAYEIAKRGKQPILLELWDRRYFYFATKFETNIVDSQGKAAALSTVQIDVENPETFGITYTDSNGEAQTPLMLHTSVSGSIDRNLYAMLEQQAIDMKKGKKANFPFWLAPTQLRLIPVKEEQHLDHCKELAEKLNCRADIDDSSQTLGKRIRTAEREWIPLIVVVGDREIEEGVLPVRIRGQKKQEKMSLEELNTLVSEKMGDKIFRPLNLPVQLSLRPIFRG